MVCWAPFFLCGELTNKGLHMCITLTVQNLENVAKKLKAEGLVVSQKLKEAIKNPRYDDHYTYSDLGIKSYKAIEIAEDVAFS